MEALLISNPNTIFRNTAGHGWKAVAVLSPLLIMPSFESNYLVGIFSGIACTAVVSIWSALCKDKLLERLLVPCIPLAITAFLAIHFTVACSPGYIDPVYSELFAHVIDNNQYGYLADALLSGKTYLDVPVPEELAQLSNPYNYDIRYHLAVEKGIEIIWDFAFYDGKYYCYFGVIPAILLYIPKKLITGSMLSTPTAIAVLGCGLILCSALLMHRVAKRYFTATATPFSLLLCWLLFVGASNVFYLGFVSRFYSVPILTSLCLTMLGLWFWLGARKESDGIIVLSKRHLAVGSFLMALNFGSRPQFFLACFLAIPLFWQEIVHERLIFSRKQGGVANSLASLGPAFIAVIPLMIYNFARFGSFFDFGSNYNLTGFDMTSYSQDWRSTALAVFYYFFQPFDLVRTFPFIRTTEVSFPNGPVPTEPMFGGIFWLVPGLLIILLLPMAAQELKKRGLLKLIVLMGFISLFTFLVDVRTAGVSQRYFSDFIWYLAIIASLTFLALQARFAAYSQHKTLYRVLHLAMSASLALSVLVGGLSFLAPNRIDSISNLNPSMYSKLEELCSRNT